MNWIRVTRQQPCPICEKDSWCTYNSQVVLCMRSPSNRPKTLKSGEQGWIHPINGAPIVSARPKEKPAPVINVGKLMEDWHAATEWNQIIALAESLGVMPGALGRLGCAWAREHRAWAFPMSDGFGNFVGIRLRTADGHKFAVRGSHQGIFLPGGDTQYMALICEGPTDAAAAITLGFYALGRPSCSGGMTDCITALRRLRCSCAIIIADADEPGVRGAKMLEDHLPMPNATLVLPTKDLREFVNLGGTADLLQGMINGLVLNQPKRP